MQVKGVPVLGAETRRYSLDMSGKIGRFQDFCAGLNLAMAGDHTLGMQILHC